MSPLIPARDVHTSDQARAQSRHQSEISMRSVTRSDARAHGSGRTSRAPPVYRASAAAERARPCAHAYAQKLRHPSRYELGGSRRAMRPWLRGAKSSPRRDRARDRRPHRPSIRCGPRGGRSHCGRDAAEMRPRCGRDAAETRPRCGRDAAETHPSGARSSTCTGSAGVDGSATWMTRSSAARAAAPNLRRGTCREMHPRYACENCGEVPTGRIVGDGAVQQVRWRRGSAKITRPRSRLRLAVS